MQPSKASRILVSNPLTSERQHANLVLLAVMSLDPSANPKCRHCGSMDVDNQLRTFFGVFVCAKDKAERPDEYSLLTKTECKEDYLLTECESLWHINDEPMTL